MSKTPSRKSVKRGTKAKAPRKSVPKEPAKDGGEANADNDLPPETEESEAAEHGTGSHEESLESDEESPEEAAQLRRRYLLRRFWHTALRFWTTPGRHVAWLLSAALLVVILLNLAAAYAMNLWNRSIFDALEKKDGGTVLSLSLIYFAILAASVVVSIALVYVRMTMQRRWRRWLTDTLVDRWLKSGRYYQLNLVSGDHKNPEFRIADDVRIATEAPVDFVTGVIQAFLSAATFIVVLWTIGGTLRFSLGGSAIAIPGFLVIAAVLYALVASGAMLLIGRRFVSVSEGKNQAEAELRYVLTRLRENGESIALIQGEAEERAGVESALAKVLKCWRSICIQNMKTSVVSSASVRSTASGQIGSHPEVMAQALAGPSGRLWATMSRPSSPSNFATSTTTACIWGAPSRARQSLAPAAVVSVPRARSLVFSGNSVGLSSSCDAPSDTVASL